MKEVVYTGPGRRPRLKKDRALATVWFWLLVALIIVVGALWVSNGGASSAEPEEGRAEALPKVVRGVERGIRHLLRGVKRSDPRVLHAPDLARIISEESAALSEDPYLITAMSFHESSFRPGNASVGKIGERGLMQVHGESLTKCRSYVGRRGIPPETPRAEVACGVWTLARGQETCGYVVEDEAACRGRLEGCRGALAWYLSGRCAAEDAGSVARSVRVRLQTRSEIASWELGTIPQIAYFYANSKYAITR